MHIDPSAFEDILTPALVISPEAVRHNVRETLRLLGGRADRWRPHLKTAKLGVVMRMLVDAGVMQGKCATTLELITACEAGFDDVLVAFAHQASNARRIRQIAARFPKMRISALVEAPDHVDVWRDGPVSLFVDVNPGMNRTGAAPENVRGIVDAIRGAGVEFRGLHFYDGHLNDESIADRTRKAHAGYDVLMQLAEGVSAPEVVTAGTPAFPCSLTYERFLNAGFIHRVSPGTVVYNDLSSVRQVPGNDYRCAVTVLARVVSRPRPDVFTCDAGHKALAVDAGVPHGRVVGYPEYELLKPSEEHLPIRVPPQATAPAIGDLISLLPKHVCPTVNMFDDALFAEDGRVISLERVSARGHEAYTGAVTAESSAELAGREWVQIALGVREWRFSLKIAT